MNKLLEDIDVIVIDNNKENRKHLLATLDQISSPLTIHICESIADANIKLLAQSPLLAFYAADLFVTDAQLFFKEVRTLLRKTDVITYSHTPDGDAQDLAEELQPFDHLRKEEIMPLVLEKIIRYSASNLHNTELLREAQERFSLLARATNHIAWDWELSRKSALWLGNGLRTYLKFPRNEMRVGANFWEKHLHPDDKSRVLKHLNDIFAGAVKSNWEDSYRLKNMEGEYRFIHDKGFIIYKNREPVRMVGLMEDITSKIELEERLESEKELQQKQITEAVVTAQEKERSEIGRELHDNVNQLLGASRLYVDAAKTDTENSDFLLLQASTFIKTAIDEIRILSKVLHTPLISEIGLMESLENLAEEIMTVNKVVIKINTDQYDESILNYNFKLTVYRIIQEQLTNILKHAQADNINISVSSDENNFHLSIADNGVGFDTKQKRKGIGLSNIASRTRLYNGKMLIESSPGNGTLLKVHFPDQSMIVQDDDLIE